MSLAPSRTIYSITPCSYPDPGGAVGFTASFGGWQREYNISPGPRNTKKIEKKCSGFTCIRNIKSTQIQESTKKQRHNRTTVSNRLHQARFSQLEMFGKPCIVSIGGGAK